MIWQIITKMRSNLCRSTDCLRKKKKITELREEEKKSIIIGYSVHSQSKAIWGRGEIKCELSKFSSMIHDGNVRAADRNFILYQRINKPFDYRIILLLDIQQAFELTIYTQPYFLLIYFILIIIYSSRVFTFLCCALIIYGHKI